MHRPDTPDRPSDPESPEEHLTIVTAHGLSLTGPRGPVYRDVDLSLPPGGLAAVSGEAGTGRTSLLLTLAGRMRPTSGTVSVAGRTTLRAIQRVAAIGAVRGVNELEDTLTVGEHVFESIHLRQGLLPRRRGRYAEDVRAALAPAGLDLAPDTLVGDLRPAERHLLGAALGLMARPRLLLLDDVDAGLRIDDQHAMWIRLRELTARADVAIIATCVDAGPADGLIDAEIPLGETAPGGSTPPDPPTSPEPSGLEQEGGTR